MTGRRAPGSTSSPCDGNPFDLNRNNTMSARKHITNTLRGAALGLAALCAAVSCGKASSVDAPVPSPSFTVDDGGAMGSLGIATRTVLSAPDIPPVTSPPASTGCAWTSRRERHTMW